MILLKFVAVKERTHIIPVQPSSILLHFMAVEKAVFPVESELVQQFNIISRSSKEADEGWEVYL